MATVSWRRKGKPGPRRAKEPNPCKIFVGNISYRTSQKELAEFFSAFGEVKYCQIVKDHRKGWSKGIGFVTFKSVEAVELTLSASEEELILDGRPMHVSKPQTKKRLQALQDAEGCGSDDGCEEDVTKRQSDHHTSQRHESGTKSAILHGEDKESHSSSNPVECSHSRRLPELNDDALRHVFSYLGLKDRVKVERVCRRWCQVARSSWQSVRKLSFQNVFQSFKGRYGGLTDGILHSILRRGCRELRSLDLSNSPHLLTDYALDLIGMYCSKLERLDMSFVSVTQSPFKLFTQRCNRIKWLKMSGCHQIGEKCLWWALHHCSGLEYLNVAGNRRINGQCFFVVGKMLNTVIVRECEKLTDPSVTFLLKENQNLEVLDISCCPLLTGATIRNAVQVRSIQEIDYIEEETMATGDQDPALPWHVDRTDQRRLPLDRLYQPIGDGEGVDVYILDSGVNYRHEEFENRAKYAGKKTHCPLLKELYIAGPNLNMKNTDMTTLGKLDKLEVLVVDSQVAFVDEELFALGRNCLNLRKLSCGACYGISDAGLHCLTSCTQLSDLTISYCHQVTDDGLMKVAGLGVLERLIARACQGITDKALCLLAEKCTNLSELDISGCLSISNKTVYAFQESLLHMREPGKRQFTFVVGGTSIDGEVATQFAAVTGATISLHDLSINSLSADYDPYMDIPPLGENWDEDDEPPTKLSPALLKTDSDHDLQDFDMHSAAALRPNFLVERAEDFLLADDPAMFSDEFSDPEEWELCS